MTSHSEGLVTIPPAPAPADDHRCWWRDLAEGLAGTLADLDSDSALSALRQILRSEQKRRRAAEQRVAELEYAVAAGRGAADGPA